MNTTKRYPLEVREHAVNLVLRQQHERDTGLRNGVSTAEREQLKSLVIRSRINWLTWLSASSAPPDRSNRGSLTLRM